MQVDPIKPMLKAPGTNLLTLKYNERLSTFAFTFNLCHYSKLKSGSSHCAKQFKEASVLFIEISDFAALSSKLPAGRGLHSSTSQLNLSRF